MVGRPTVWLVEDNPADVFLLQEVLREEQVECDLRVLEDGDAALSAVSGHAGETPALVLLDLNLPRHRGSEVLLAIRQHAQLAGVPVVVLTSSEWSSDRREAVSAGASGFLRKPSDIERFLEIGAMLRGLLGGV